MPPPKTYWVDDPDNDCEVEVQVPTRWGICDRCRGDGTQDPWDGGMTADEMYELGEEFIEDYRAGRYDRPCSECNGQGKVLTLDEDRATPEQANLYHQHAEADADLRAMERAERAMGC